MWGVEALFYLYLAVGCGIALISLSMNWNESRRLSPMLFVFAHALWPLSIGAILFCAYIQSRR
ncbi:hypothetical protein [Methylosinus sp. Sm6]|uniref:hypothetical protein n=1 Tax=Methylosinus sp. Sm6 TaxID=2866948 RepID=UPI001C9A2466|nr:hypothetical protein [Methylosinus sp. Sm6]MBY6241986.1 hypothetical protein [Methylosinus sp. Sm6]